MVMSEKSIFAIIIGLLFHIQVFAADWPQWRGPNRDGVWREKGIVQKFEDWRPHLGKSRCCTKRPLVQYSHGTTSKQDMDVQRTGGIDYQQALIERIPRNQPN